MRTVRSVLAEAADLLSRVPAGLDASGRTIGEVVNPRLDSTLLLAKAMETSRTRLLACGPDPVSEDCYLIFSSLIERRSRGESIAYLLGYREFYGRDFLVDRRVLVPRADTELLVERALAELDRRLAAGSPVRVHDCFTGSGCVGVTLAAERPAALVSLSDLSADALQVAGDNALRLLGKALPGWQSDTLSQVSGSFEIITANPPYVASALADAILAGGSAEPRLALDGGTDGLAPYRRLVSEAWDRLVFGGCLLMEIGEEQAGAVRDLCQARGYGRLAVYQDLAGDDRVVAGYKDAE